MDFIETQKYAELIEKAGKGDRAALEQLCREVAQILKGYFTLRYPNQKVVEELTQETCLRLLTSLPKLKDPQKFSYFMAKIALHVHQNYLHNKYESIEHTKANLETIAPANTRHQALQFGSEVEIENRVDLERAFRFLPKRTQKVLRMKFEGMRYKEIAKSLHISVRAVKMIVYRGKKRIKLFFKE